MGELAQRKCIPCEGGTPKLDAVSNVSRQFRSRSFPEIGGWSSIAP